jgi:hypothetical protein
MEYSTGHECADMEDKWTFLTERGSGQGGSNNGLRVAPTQNGNCSNEEEVVQMKGIARVLGCPVPGLVFGVWCVWQFCQTRGTVCACQVLRHGRGSPGGGIARVSSQEI